MRFSTVLIGVFASLAAAQTPVNTPAVTQTGADPAQTSLSSAIETCIRACALGDVSCTAKCVAVPNPSEAQISATNQCVAACPKGNGTEADNKKYSDCMVACIGQNYFTASAPGPQTAGPNAANPTNPANPTGAGPSNTPGATGASGSGGAPASTNKPNGAAVYTGSSAAGLLAFMAAFLAY